MRQQFQLWRGEYGFSKQDFEYFEQLVESIQTDTATVGKDEVADTKARSSKISWLNNSPWLRERLWSFAEEANRRAFAFDVTRSCDIQYTEYLAEDKGHYDWHIDTLFGHDKTFDRKLSLTVQLSDPSDYEGGEFDLEFSDLPDWYKEKGTILVFPSYLKHRVAPVTKGKRKSLVVWFEGPRWR